MRHFPETMSARIKGLHDSLLSRAQGDRSEEWFTPSMFPDFWKLNPKDYGLVGKMQEQTVLVRRAVAIDVMLKAMTDPENSEKTHTAAIECGDLLLGVLPMGSNGLGKVFPQFLTPEELRAGSITNRNAGSLFGHNSLNYEHLLSRGLDAIIAECEQKLAQPGKDKAEGKNAQDVEQLYESGTLQEQYKKRTHNDFYRGVKIACRAVIEYAERFAAIAEAQAEKTSTPARRKELMEMAAIARKVPAKPAETFHEAVQSIAFFHIALHASMNFISLGRLDMVLNPYLEREKDTAKALEIMECFLIKMAGRLNLSSDYLWQQDHVDYATVLGTHPYYIDQKAGVNNFLQNIIIGGKTPEGEDATSDATHLILNACTQVNLSTPGIYVRLHDGTPEELLRHVAESLSKTRNNPAILNDEVMIPAMYDALMQDDRNDGSDSWKSRSAAMQRLANDYCVGGCWEPILNGESDWTFTMSNAMNALEAAMNRGASLSPDGELFRGAKISPTTPEPTSYRELVECFRSHLGFFTDQCVLSMFLYYGIDEYAAPSPLMSALMGGCMERGRDKAWAGANYNLAGVIYGGVPNVINTLAALRKWVFPERGKGKYTLEEVCNAFRYNFICADPTRKDIQNTYTSIQIDFDTNSPKFGNNDKDADAIAREVVDICYEAVMHSAAFGKKVFQNDAKPGEYKRIKALRQLAGYFGTSLSKKYGSFEMKVTAGMGTFEQYNWQGRGIAASADRKSGEPLAPNFSPMPGTTRNGVAGLFSSLSKLDLDRFAGGVICDLCLEETYGDEETLTRLLRQAIEDKVPMLTVAVGSKDIYRKIYETVIAAGKLTNKDEVKAMLAPYAGINVRIGGWQTPFITLPISHMENYLQRPVAMA